MGILVFLFLFIVGSIMAAGKGDFSGLRVIGIVLIIIGTLAFWGMFWRTAGMNPASTSAVGKVVIAVFAVGSSLYLLTQ